jgi:hypothetical protein
MMMSGNDDDDDVEEDEDDSEDADVGTDPKTATHSLREGIQMPQTKTRTTVLREREQLKCTW